MELALIESVLSIAVRAGTSVLFATLGGIMTERSGVAQPGHRRHDAAFSIGRLCRGIL